MSNNSSPKDKNFIKSKVSKILDELSMQHETEFIEADMVALFEDVANFFSGREGDFLNFDALSEDAKLAIYTEIKTIIVLLKKMRGSTDKQLVMEILSKNLISQLYKHSEKFISVTEQLSKQEQKNLKRRFADATLLELYKKRQLYVAQNKNIPEKLMNEIDTYVKSTMLGSKISASRSSPPKSVNKKQKTSNISRFF